MNETAQNVMRAVWIIATEPMVAGALVLGVLALGTAIHAITGEMAYRRQQRLNKAFIEAEVL